MVVEVVHEKTNKETRDKDGQLKRLFLGDLSFSASFAELIT